MNIIQQRKVEYVMLYSHSFTNEGGGGYGFDCDEKGVLKPLENEAAKKNYENCLKGIDESGNAIVDEGIVSWEQKSVTPAMGLCDSCKAEVYLTGFTNTCECGADYNMSGHQLAPRSQWGEETGETADDVLAVDYKDSSCEPDYEF